MNSGIAAQPITNALLRWILSKRRPEAHRDPLSGRFLIPYAAVYVWAVRVAAIVFAVFLVLSTIALQGDTRALLLAGGIFSVFLLMAGYAWYEASLVSMSFSEEGIFTEPRFGSARLVPWPAIKTVDYSDAASSFTFRADRGGKVQVSIYRNGLKTFAEYAERELARTLDGPAIERLRRIAAGNG